MQTNKNTAKNMKDVVKKFTFAVRFIFMTNVK